MRNSFTMAVEYLIRQNQYSKVISDLSLKHINPVSYAQNFKTIRVKAQRGSGHTTFIRNKAKPDLDIVIVAPQALKYWQDTNLNVVSSMDIPYRIIGMKLDFRYVFVDDASYLFLSLLNEGLLYETFVYRGKQDLFIFLG